jgi:hypothetical protein
MDIDEQFTTMRNLQHQEIGRLEALTDRVESLSEQIARLMDWLQEPPSSDLSETLKAMVQSMDAMNGILTAPPAAIADEMERRRPVR